jgi:hypothetical protein
VRQLSANQVQAAKVVELGLDSGALDLTAVEAIAGALRRAAGALCPCTAATLVRSVFRPLRGLVPTDDALKESIEDTLEALVAYGDLLEERDIEQEPHSEAASMLYAAPPAFVRRESGATLLLGLVSSQSAALPSELEARVEYLNHVRRLQPQPGQDLRAELTQYGFLERSEDKWLKLPARCSPAQLVATLDAELDAVSPSRDVPGLSLLDPVRPVRYYRGRWVNVKSQTGRYVARRSQAYGADRWCYVEIESGQPERLVDFPLTSSRWRGCDEAWRLQMAIDAPRGTPQQFRLRSGPEGTHILELFSPVPMWARRRWDAVGTPASASGFPGANPCVHPGANPVPGDSCRNDGPGPRRMGAARVGDGVLGEGGATPSGSRSPLAPPMEMQFRTGRSACSARVTTDVGKRAPR